MAVTCKTNFDDFNRDFRARVARSKQALPVITNRVAFMVAKAGFDAVQKAERSKIEQLGVIGYKLSKDRKTGKLKKGGKVFATGEGISRATNIFIAELRKRGYDPRKIQPGQMQKLVQAWINERLRAVGSLKAAFIPVVKKLFSVLNESQSLSYHGIAAFGRARGHAELAKEGWKPACKFDVAGGGKNDANIEQVEQYLTDALDAGFAAAMKDFETYAAKELNPILGK
jgi:hypothetical protein